MISSLANFLVLLLYQGGYPARVSWTLLMFTMGAVAVARIAIENDRTYALGYLFALSLASFVAMSRFVGAPLFSIFMLGLIAYLADRIVHDCTLIDESVDASGQGLIDTGRHFVRQQLKHSDSGSDADDEAISKDTSALKKRKTHQPGRTVMLLAIAALPLFGLGQFFLRGDSATSARALWLLAIYLFASLSLLVTTSFLGLRRYLRQRGVDMPTNVSIGWITGGLVLIALILAIAYLAPMPGRVLASFEFPTIIESSKDFSASRFGWGEEAAEKKNDRAKTTRQDQDVNNKEVQEITSEQGAPPGEAQDGQQSQGTPGQQEGGKDSASGSSDQSQPSQNATADKQSEAMQSNSSESAPEQSPASSQSDSNTPQNDAAKQDTPSEDTSSSDTPSNDTASNDKGEQKHSPENSGQENDSTAKSNKSTDPNQSDPADDVPSEQDQATGSSAENSPSLPRMLSDALSILGSLFRFVIAIALASVVLLFVWLHRETILNWWRGLFAGRSPSDEADTSGTEDASMISDPARPFASFRNPVGREQDLRRVVIITFQAFEAWTREQGMTRRKDETPAEFMKRAGATIPNQNAAAMKVVDAYNRIVYGGGRATTSDVSAAGNLWQAMSR